MTLGSRFTSSDAEWLLGSFCAAARRPFDPALLAQQFPAPLSLDRLAEAAQALGLALRVMRLPRRALSAQRFPMAVRWQPADAPVTALPWALVLAADDARVLVLPAGATEAVEVSVAQFRQCASAQAIAAPAQAPEAADPDLIVERRETFNLRWFVPEVLKHRSIWRDVLTASLVVQLLALGLPLFTQVIIDKVIVHRSQSTLIALGAGMVIFLIFSSLLSWIRQYLILHTGNRIDAVLGARVFDHLIKLPPLYFQHRPTGVISARLQGIETIREFLASAAITLLLDLPFMVIFLAIMFLYSTTLTLVVLGVLSLIVLLSLAVAPSFQRRLQEQFQRGAANQAFVTEYIAGIDTVKSMQFEPQLTAQYRELLAALLKTTFATRQLGNTYNTLASALEQIMTLTILILGAWIVMTTATLTVGMLVAFQMFASRISQPLLRLVGLWQQWQQTRLAIARLGDILNAPTEPYSAVPQRANLGAGQIVVEDMGFRYGAALPFVYERLNLEVRAGELVAIMGPSGCGKSTLAKLLQGFYQPTRGRIRVDGVDVTHLSANELRTRLGVVPQETVLFSGSIQENLRLANPFATQEQLVAACRMAEIHSTIEALPQGYDTNLGERGVGLSGGQRQRIAIARALLKGPKVLIFDEATSSLDAATAEAFTRTINGLKGRATILFITHAMPKGLQVDRVIRMGDATLTVVPSDKAETMLS